MKNGRIYLKNFALRGLISMGFGPIVLSVVYCILDIVGVVDYMKVSDMVLGILTITVLAFFAGGITVVFQIEEIGLSLAITLHGIVLYLCYATVYLVNSWLKEGVIPFLVFTAIFVIGYLFVWTIIYFTTRKSTDKVNNSMKM